MHLKASASAWSAARTLSRKCAFDKPKRLPHAPRAVKGMIFRTEEKYGSTTGFGFEASSCLLALHIDLTMIYVTISSQWPAHVCV